MGLPIVLLFVFLGVALSLEGAENGVEAYIGIWDMSGMYILSVANDLVGPGVLMRLISLYLYVPFQSSRSKVKSGPSPPPRSFSPLV